MSHDPSPPRPPGSLLVLGLGNVLCGDDGLGVEAVTRLSREYRIPPAVQVLDGGTLGLSLLGYLAEASRVLLVDAVRTEAPPGSLVRLDGDDVAPAVRERLSVHQVGVSDLLDGLHLLGAYPEVMVLLGLVPQTLELGLERSVAVDRNLPSLVESVAAEIGALGFPLARVPPGDPLGGGGANERWNDAQASTRDLWSADARLAASRL